MKAELRDRLLREGLSADGVARVVAYWELLCVANERQNLTKLIEPGPFFSGHVLDVLELRRLRGRGSSAGPSEVPPVEWLDLGSGAGVPGLLSGALFTDERWVLLDAEHRKAEFLTETVRALGLQDRIRVVHGRAEALGGRFTGPGIASKAVGSVEKLFGWMRECSTWNTLTLFKGPKWSEEWAEFGRSRHRGLLEEAGRAEYSTPEGATRLIIQLKRVPRGTKNPKK